MHGQLSIRSPDHIFESADVFVSQREKYSKGHPNSRHISITTTKGVTIKNKKTKNSPRLKHDIRHLIIIHIPRVLGLVMADLDSLGAAAGAGRVGQQLGLHAAVHGAEQEGRAVDALAHGQVPVVLQDHGLGRPQRRGDVRALGLFECDAPERRVQAVVFVESVAAPNKNQGMG